MGDGETEADGDSDGDDDSAGDASSPSGNSPERASNSDSVGASGETLGCGETSGDALGASGVVVGSGVTSTLGETDALGDAEAEEVGEGDVDAATSDASGVGTGVCLTTTHSSKPSSRTDPASPPDVSADTADTGASNRAHDSAITRTPRPERSTKRR
ncbi:MAG: hypothetical protein K9G12_01725 [Candidatus Nanopelagicales bacterium]|nr:hypothetical protein [Candidatus Nanopelagicales bacterium]